MNPLKNMSFNVKPVRDDDLKLTHEERIERHQANIDVARQYSAVAQDLVAGIAGTLVAASLTIIIAKGGVDIIKIGMKLFDKK